MGPANKPSPTLNTTEGTGIISKKEQMAMQLVMNRDHRVCLELQGRDLLKTTKSSSFQGVQGFRGLDNFEITREEMRYETILKLHEKRWIAELTP